MLGWTIAASSRCRRRHLDLGDPRPGEGQGALAAGLLPGPSLERQQELREVGRHDVDEALRQRLLIGERAALDDRLFGERDVAAVAAGQRADRRRGVLLDLLAHDPFDGLALSADRMGRTGVRPRCHGGEVGCHQQEETRRGGLRPGGRDVDDHRRRRPEHRGRDLAGRREQPTGSVELHDQKGGAGAVGVRQRFDQELLRHRMQDRPQAQVHDGDRRAWRVGRRRTG